jgi:hypothetical protein
MRPAGVERVAGARHLCRFNVRTEWWAQLNPMPPAIRLRKRHKCRAPAALSARETLKN